jgi:hypothetical protein
MIAQKHLNVTLYVYSLFFFFYFLVPT